MFDMLEQIYEEVRVIRQIVTGNGRPDDGMVVKQARMEERQKLVEDNILDVKNALSSLSNKIDEYNKGVTNRRTGNGKFIGFIPKKLMETVWMWVVRGVILTVLTLFGWLCGNSEKVSKLIDSIPK